MSKFKKIYGKGIYLRELTLDDVTPEYCGWLNDPEVNKYLETRKSTLRQLRSYVRQKISNPNCWFFGIFDKENDKHIGNVKLEIIDKKKKRADFGILMGNKNYWGKGVGTEATKLAIDYGFYQLGFQEIELGVIDENKIARKMFEGCGFRIKEIQKKAVNHDGILYDKVIMAIKKLNL